MNVFFLLASNRLHLYAIRVFGFPFLLSHPKFSTCNLSRAKCHKKFPKIERCTCGTAQKLCVIERKRETSYNSLISRKFQFHEFNLKRLKDENKKKKTSYISLEIGNFVNKFVIGAWSNEFSYMTNQLNKLNLSCDYFFQKQVEYSVCHPFPS